MYRLYKWIGGKPRVDLLQGTNSATPIRRGEAIHLTEAQAQQLMRSGFVLEEVAEKSPVSKTPAKTQAKATARGTSSRRSRATKPKPAETPPAETSGSEAAEGAAE